MLSLCTADSTNFTHRVNASTFSEQTRMELLVSGIPEKCALYDDFGDFDDIYMWAGVSLRNRTHVVAIQWSDTSGVFKPGGSMDLQWIPPEVVLFDISCMELEGSIDTFALPRKLEILYIGYNRFSGDFVLKGLPPTLITLCGGDNQFQGIFPIADLPRRLVNCNMQNNKFSGSLDIPALPATCESVDLSRNQFVGQLDLRTLPADLLSLKLTGNVFADDLILVGAEQGRDGFSPCGGLQECGVCVG